MGCELDKTVGRVWRGVVVEVVEEVCSLPSIFECVVESMVIRVVGLGFAVLAALYCSNDNNNDEDDGGDDCSDFPLLLPALRVPF